MPGKLTVFTLALCVAVSKRPSLAQSDNAQAQAQASTHPSDAAAVTALMPQPRSVQYGDGWLQVQGSFQVKWLGYRNSMLDRAVLRFQNDVARRTGLDLGRPGTAQIRVNCRGEDKGIFAFVASRGTRSGPEGGRFANWTQTDPN